MKLITVMTILLLMAGCSESSIQSSRILENEYYRIELTERSLGLLRGSEVHATAFLKGDRNIRYLKIYNGDAPGDFNNLYFPKNEWISDNTIHLFLTGDPDRRPKGIIELENKTEDLVPMIALRASESFYLFFDLAPGEKREIKFRSSGANNWFNAIAVTNQLDKVHRTDHASSSKSLDRYSLLILEDMITIKENDQSETLDNDGL